MVSEHGSTLVPSIINHLWITIFALQPGVMANDGDSGGFHIKSIPHADSIHANLTTKMAEVMIKTSTPAPTADTSVVLFGIKLDDTSYVLWPQVVEMCISGKDKLE